MPPLRHIHGRPPGTPSRCRPSATPSLRCVVRFGAQRNYRCPGQARRPSKFPSPSFSAWSTPSATPPDTAHFRSFGEMLNQSAQIMVGGKSSSGAQTERTGLSEALAYVREGDTLVVWKLDRLGRSLKDLITRIRELSDRKIGFQSLTENIDTKTSGGKLIFHIFGALAEFERDIIRERTNAG